MPKAYVFFCKIASHKALNVCIGLACFAFNVFNKMQFKFPIIILTHYSASHFVVFHSFSILFCLNCKLCKVESSILKDDCASDTSLDFECPINQADEDVDDNGELPPELL